MAILKCSLAVGICLAAGACRGASPGSKGGSDNTKTIDGTGHTGNVTPANGTPGDPNTPPGERAGAPTGSNAGSAPANTTPTGTGNSNTDMTRPGNGSGSGSGSGSGHVH